MPVLFLPQGVPCLVPEPMFPVRGAQDGCNRSPGLPLGQAPKKGCGCWRPGPCDPLPHCLDPWASLAPQLLACGLWAQQLSGLGPSLSLLLAKGRALRTC
jgi:hypothetical protein